MASVMRYYFAVLGIDQRWHTAYRAPGGGDLTSTLDCPNREAAEQEARRLNQEVAAEAQSEVTNLHYLMAANQ